MGEETSKDIDHEPAFYEISSIRGGAVVGYPGSCSDF
jgi:hypothetical protein